MTSTPLFSTYRQGENHVTLSMLAVFERVGLSLTETILARALGEPTLGNGPLHQPAVQPRP